ncbi:serine/threonine protein kinase [Ectothiorhodospiraceae bacterium WFHF3C12]|nr:serine/threonine protein kinase [Ectothiorhodospiraceae bacterium WFHF3C12]
MGVAVPDEHPYAELTPATILAAVESFGWLSDGRLLPLNSYENRVYQVGIEEDAPVVVKFYRPDRWSDAAIEEEHAFAFELAEAEIPVVAPLRRDGHSLLAWEGFRFAVFPRRGGRPPELDLSSDREWLGRFLGRIHTVGEARAFQHRPRLDAQAFGHETRRYLLEQGWLPAELESVYEGVSADALLEVDACFQRAAGVDWIRVHGDCHPGNVLWTDDGPHFVDLDDCRMAPAIQDLWMLLSGPREEQVVQIGEIVEAYETFREFDPRELHLVEALRTLRIMHFAAWLARRWDDPAFPQAFPWFAEPRFWEEHILSLREQIAAMQEPPLPI